ncbi:MAG TPA: PilN domain-containing protein [Myxococcota bacterium]|nr:PilN domain-containing protein [Myxococcota bacterium]
MIRINLLPVREARRAANMRKQGMLLVFAAGAGVVICLLISTWMAARIAHERSLVTAREAELKKLEATMNEVKKFQAEQQEIEQKLAIIDQIEAARMGPVKIMDELATRIPQRVWLTKMVEKGGTLELEGRSIDAEVVADFVVALEESPMLSNVDLQETTLEEVEGLKLSDFKLTAQYPFVKEAGADRGKGKKGGAVKRGPGPGPAKGKE